MANYTDGTIEMTEGSRTIRGTGTAWLENVRPGQYFTVAGLCRPYQVSEVIDDTTLKLTRPINMINHRRPDLRLTQQVYSILDSFTPNISIPFIGKDDINKQPRIARVVNTIDTAMGTVLGWQALKDRGLLP